jgi:hypothetical protein
MYTFFTYTLKEITALTAKSVPAGTNNSCAEGFLLVKHLKHTAHKHPHHDGAVSPSSRMVLMDTPNWTWVTSSKGVGQGRLGWV